jgi:G:T-mismatch repair DNA endonuclease (very short patch repair protein)
LRKCGHNVIVVWEKEMKENPNIVMDRWLE